MNEDFLISPIGIENKNFCLSNELKDEKQFIDLISQENGNRKKFDFSTKNFYPRNKVFDVEFKLNMENYYNNNYLPAKIDPEECEISKNYYNEFNKNNNNTIQCNRNYPTNYNNIYNINQNIHINKNSNNESFLVNSNYRSFNNNIPQISHFGNF